MVSTGNRILDTPDTRYDHGLIENRGYDNIHDATSTHEHQSEGFRRNVIYNKIHRSTVVSDGLIGQLISRMTPM